ATVARLEAAPPEVRAEAGDDAEAVAGTSGGAASCRAGGGRDVDGVRLGECKALGKALESGEPATVARLEAAPPEVRAEVGDGAGGRLAGRGVT
ncbi:MAG: hypothetical protein IKQ15_01910, partial [Kiritimatiellae bacterium]|nr:hypothetical protein [Kiritimatiellia bacterium]